MDRADGSSFALSICEDGCISDVKDKIEVLAGISSYKQTLYPAVATKTGKRKREQGPCADTMKVTCLPSRKLLLLVNNPVDLIKRRAFVPIVKKGESNNPTASKFHGKVTSKTRCTKRQPCQVQICANSPSCSFDNAKNTVFALEQIYR